MSAIQTLRLARPAFAAFAAMGMLWGAFAADLPDIKAGLGIDEAHLGALLLMTPVAALLGMLAAPFVAEFGGSRALPLSVALMALAFAIPGHVSNLWLFPVALMGCGFGTGMTDVLMNARVAALENRQETPLMNLCHAGYSFGYAAGAVVTGIMRSAGWPPATVLTAMAVIALLFAMASSAADGQIDDLRHNKTLPVVRLGWLPLIGGGIALVAFVTENAMELWSALFIEQTLGAAAGQGAAGPAVMAVTMGVARLFGQGLATRIPTVKLLTLSAVVAASGALIAATAVSPTIAYVGFFVIGIGASTIAPTAFTLVGRMASPSTRARAIARATMVGYCGYFFGPPLVGMLAGQFGLRWAFVFAAVILATVPILARLAAKRN